MRTIFIPIQGRSQARNILRTDVLKTLLEQSEIRVVVFVPMLKRPGYMEEFGYWGPRIVFEGLENFAPLVSKIDGWFQRLALFYVNSPTLRSLKRYWLWDERGHRLRYFFSLFLLNVFGRIRWLRRLCRRLDYELVVDRRLSYFFDRYQPKIIFAPCVNSSLDRSFLREAKRRGGKSVGMINSWDSITYVKYPFRLLPDLLIAHNEVIKREAVSYLDVPAGKIIVSGLPQFDHYICRRRSPRSELCRRLGLSESARILLFASIGSVLNPTEGQVLQLLDQAMAAGRLPPDLVVVFRQHPTEPVGVEGASYSPRIVFDDSKSAFNSSARTYFEITTNDLNHLADSLEHAAVSINTCSTMSIDAAALDRPVVNIAFDGWETCPLYRSVRRFYLPSHDHYQPIVKSGGVRVAYSFDELVTLINLYLEQPSLDREGRKRIVQEQCYKLDGRAGERIGQAILNLLVSE